MTLEAKNKQAMSQCPQSSEPLEEEIFLGVQLSTHKIHRQPGGGALASLGFWRLSLIKCQAIANS